MNISDPVVIVGAGPAGLCCAQHLQALAIPYVLLEATDRPGGRIQTDDVNGFRLDRGFQVLLEAYPACQEMLDMTELSQHAFGSGAYIYDGDSLRLFADPVRHPEHALTSMLHPAGTLGDKWKLRQLQRKLSRLSMEELGKGEEQTTTAYWEDAGFSSRIQESFLTPFFRGIFLENTLSTPASMFRFVYAMFGKGKALLPEGGIGAVTDQLVAGLGEGCIRTGARVTSFTERQVLLESGEMIDASAVVLATDGGIPGKMNSVTWNAVTCIYFAADCAPVSGPWLLLNGSGKGRVNQVAVVSQVAPKMAPPGSELISVSINGILAEKDDDIIESVRRELREWFGDQVISWNGLKVYRIEKALPALRPGQFPGKPPFRHEGAWVCGDMVRHPSLQGAMESGKRTAKAVAEELASS